MLIYGVSAHTNFIVRASVTRPANLALFTETKFGDQNRCARVHALSAIAAMGAGSHFQAMSSLQLASRVRSNAAVLPGRGLRSVHHVSRPLCLPLHPGRHACVPRGRSQHRINAVVSAPEKVDTGNVPPFQAWTTGAAIKKREDIKSIMILGAGPIVIGQVFGPQKNALHPGSASFLN